MQTGGSRRVRKATVAAPTPPPHVAWCARLALLRPVSTSTRGGIGWSGRTARVSLFNTLKRCNINLRKVKRHKMKTFLFVKARKSHLKSCEGEGVVIDGSGSGFHSYFVQK